MSAPLWTYETLLGVMSGRPTGMSPKSITGLSIDSRSLKPGEAFFAIRGDQFDGHDFVPAALGRGAATAVVAEARLASLGTTGGPLTVVGDVLEALRDVARAARARSEARIVAVTGSVGKTGTKEMLAAALGADQPVHASPASFNNHWGVPLSLARMPMSARCGIFEIGMNHAGEIAPLVAMVRPHVAIVTNVEPVHLEFFSGVEEIAAAKAEIFSGLEPGGAALINRDNPHFSVLSELARAAGVERIIGFGEHQGAEVKLERVALKSNCSCVSATVLDQEITYKLGAPGRHVVQNSLAVLGAVALLGADLAKAALALAELEPPEGRGRRYDLPFRGGSVTLIDESYNANPASMASAISLLGDTSPGHQGPRQGRRIAVLGDMRELGKNSEVMHAALAGLIAQAGVDLVFAAGPSMAALWKELPTHRRGGYAERANELEGLLFEAIGPGDVVMVKGSNASRLAPLVQAMRTRYNPDRTSPGTRTQEPARC
jgi:UDP-N-acetylmuramoyl-tripeptide--D-alanyl-D-alanine ligase